MSNIGQPEHSTQNRIIALFRDELRYRYLGDWTDRPDNSNIEDNLLTAYLTQSGYNPAQIAKALYELRTEAGNPNRSLYDNNKKVYSVLRYGVPVKIEAGKATETVKLINWEQPEQNDFAIAEEVTLRGNLERRPDLVLYVNGIAIGVIELKNSRVSIGDGIRQNLSNQQPEFNEWFFSTVQLVFAGNDSEGLQYGAIGTPEKYFLKWKEDEADNSRFKLDKYLLKMCAKERLIELMHDFVLFDGGVKKLPRVHQYFGVKAAQQHVNAYKGGIIWHTQGSGKSIVMVMLAKWILENKPNARVVIVTDRDELDKQIEGVFTSADIAIAVYTSELDHSAGGADPEILLQDRLTKGRERLDNALEAVALICEPVEPPKGELEHIHYFCGNTEIATALAEREPQRVALYKATVALVRAYANIADELEEAGYNAADITRIKRDLDRYLNLREIIRKASGETIDLKAYEADMRHLIDTYIEADEPRKISPFDDMSLLELIVKSGIADAINSLPGGIRANKDAVAETIANNVRSKIIKEHLKDPAYYDRMSKLLEEIIADLKAKCLEYEEYLKRIAKLAKQVQSGQAEDTPEALKNSPGLRALYNNLQVPGDPMYADAVREARSLYGTAGDPRLSLALAIDETVRRVRPDDWRGHQARENEIKRALLPLLHSNAQEVERVFLIIKAQKEY